MTQLFSKHPKGLPFLFLTELFERFGYYLMIGIFLLYMKDTKSGGLGISNKEASDIFGTFIALVYLTPFIGGILADKILGYRNAVIIGGSLMGAGYCCLAIQGMSAFWGALGLMILGNGFFKPNISTLLGNLYNYPEYKVHKDAGYSIFYMGINIGAFICNFFAAYMKNTYGWGAAFITAGVGMFIGVLVFAAGMKHYAHADAKKDANADAADKNILLKLGLVLASAAVAGVLGWMIPGSIFGNDSTDAFLFSTLPIIAFYLNIWYSAAPNEKEPIAALLSIYAVVIVFWAIFKQNGTALTNWAEYYTNREVPAMVEGVIEKARLSENLNNKTATYPNYDSFFRAPLGADGKPQKVQTTAPYFINAKGKMPAEGQELKLISTEIFQSINPFFIIILTPIVIAFFANLRKRKREPSTAAKIGWGLIITSLSSVVMIFAAWACHNGFEKASAWWLVGTYGVVTIGELCLSPMGLSLVSKLAPARIAALMMGGWQLATSIGNKLSGVLAGLWDNFDHKDYFFAMNAVLTLLAGLVIFSMMRWLNRIIQQYE